MLRMVELTLLTNALSAFFGLWELSLTEDHVKEEVKQVKDMAKVRKSRKLTCFL